ncbi:complement C1q-like protein 3 [Centropristis striata]|uniref:complement C1q-like protein 3 n=1 Tax=Centropristis striata TaxID=184440 RepID=UPI0027DED8FE|nr:complement C1q-like protein 3 [Centropristis striata]
MNFTILLLVSLFSTFTVTVKSGLPDSCDLQKLCALEEKLRVMETRLTESESQILELKNKKNTTVIFSAGIDVGGGAHIGPSTRPQTLIYGEVQTNIGNAYSPTTGVFTAPVAGVYYFSIFYHSASTNPTQLELLKNTEAVLMTHDFAGQYGADRADNGGNAVFVQLQPGDQVSVRMNAKSHVWAYKHLTTFNGFLVSQMSEVNV